MIAQPAIRLGEIYGCAAHAHAAAQHATGLEQHRAAAGTALQELYTILATALEVDDRVSAVVEAQAEHQGRRSDGVPAHKRHVDEVVQQGLVARERLARRFG